MLTMTPLWLGVAQPAYETGITDSHSKVEDRSKPDFHGQTDHDFSLQNLSVKQRFINIPKNAWAILQFRECRMHIIETLYQDS